MRTPTKVNRYVPREAASVHAVQWTGDNLAEVHELFSLEESRGYRAEHSEHDAATLRITDSCRSSYWYAQPSSFVVLFSNGKLSVQSEEKLNEQYRMED